VAVDHKRKQFYVGSTKEGTIYRSNRGTQLEVFSPAGADGRTISSGMAFAQDRLIVVGRQTGFIFLYDTVTGGLISKLLNGRSGIDQTFLNDTTFAPDGSAYVTDSVDPVLYRVVPTVHGHYQLDTFLRFEGTAVNYIQATGAAGINVNGIVITEDGRYLIIAKRNENALFRIDLRNKSVLRIALPQHALDTPDGMFLEGHTLLVAQNTPRAIAVLEMSEDFISATPIQSFTHPTFEFPTSVARFRDNILVVSSQFDTLGSPAAVTGTQPSITPFWVSEINTSGSLKNVVK
jgi:sugar lactone lactonase YvrE